MVALWHKSGQLARMSRSTIVPIPRLVGAACFAAVRAGTADPEDWFPSDPRLSARNHAAVRICRTCPVIADCAAHAQLERYGIWGGEHVR